MTIQLDQILAECYQHTGDAEQRLDALRRAAEGDRGTDLARRWLASDLARSGKLSQAVTVLQSVATHRPEWRLELAQMLLRRTVHQPRDQQNWREVEQALSEAEKAMSQAAEPVTLLRADLLAAQGRLDEARALLSAARAEDPRNLHYRLALVRLGQRQGQDSAALKLLDETEKELGPGPQINVARLDYWALEGGVSGKVEVAKLAAVRDKLPAEYRPMFLHRLGSAELRLGQSDLARQFWRELAALQPDNLDVRLELIDLAIMAGDDADAAQLIDEVRKREGEQGTTWRLGRAVLLFDRARRGEQQDLDEVRQLAEELIERRPKWSGGYALKGEIAELAGSNDEAIGHYRRAIELGTARPLLVRRLVRLLQNSGRLEEIDRLAQSLRDQGAVLEEISVVKALDAIRTGDFERGLALAHQLFPVTSASGPDHLMLGRIYMFAGRTIDAGREFHRAVELAPRADQAWLTYIQYLVRSNRIEEADRALEEARRALPADRSRLTLAECALIVGELGQAEALVQTALKANAHDPTALRVAADVCLAQRRFDKADEYLRELDGAQNAAPGDRAWANRARAWLKLATGQMADRQQALDLIEENLKNDPGSSEDLEQKIAILSRSRPGRAQAIKVLEQLAGASKLTANCRFLLARLYSAAGNDQKYEGEMRTLFGARIIQPQHLAHFIRFLLGRDQLEEAAQWLAKLKKFTRPTDRRPSSLRLGCLCSRRKCRRRWRCFWLAPATFPMTAGSWLSCSLSLAL